MTRGSSGHRAALDPRKVAKAIDRAMCAGLFLWGCNELRAPPTGVLTRFHKY
jgi:hypothetical protein